MKEGGREKATRGICSLYRLVDFMITMSLYAPSSASLWDVMQAALLSWAALLPHDLATDALSFFMALSAVYQGTGDMQQPTK